MKQFTDHPNTPPESKWKPRIEYIQAVFYAGLRGHGQIPVQIRILEAIILWAVVLMQLPEEIVKASLTVLLSIGAAAFIFGAADKAAATDWPG